MSRTFWIGHTRDAFSKQPVQRLSISNSIEHEVCGGGAVYRRPGMSYLRGHVLRADADIEAGHRFIFA
eukprot:4183463-Pyramimonas_sp.AAC.2